MNSDKSVYARVDGKQNTRRNTIWTLTIGTVTVRCVWREPEFSVEALDRNKAEYVRMATGRDAGAMLDKLLSSKTIRETIDEMQQHVLERG